MHLSCRATRAFTDIAECTSLRSGFSLRRSCGCTDPHALLRLTSLVQVLLSHSEPSPRLSTSIRCCFAASARCWLVDVCAVMWLDTTEVPASVAASSSCFAPWLPPLALLWVKWFMAATKDFFQPSGSLLSLCLSNSLAACSHAHNLAMIQHWVVMRHKTEQSRCLSLTNLLLREKSQRNLHGPEIASLIGCQCTFATPEQFPNDSLWHKKELCNL
jgi:hypothetical protein